MTIEEIEELIAKNGSITAQPLRDLVVTVVLEAVAAEREAAVKDAERYRHAMREAMYLLDQPEPRPHAAFSELLRALNPNLASAKICWEHGTVDCAAAIRERGKNAHR